MRRSLLTHCRHVLLIAGVVMTHVLLLANFKLQIKQTVPAPNELFVIDLALPAQKPATEALNRLATPQHNARTSVNSSDMPAKTVDHQVNAHAQRQRSTPAPITSASASRTARPSAAHTAVTATKSHKTSTQPHQLDRQIRATQHTSPAKNSATQNSRTAIAARASEIKPATARNSHPTHTKHTSTAAYVDISTPQFIGQPARPPYPAMAKRRGQQGTVWLELLIGTQGELQQLLIWRSSGFKQLDQAALTSARDWRFSPHLINGKAVVSRVRLPIQFSIQP